MAVSWIRHFRFVLCLYVRRNGSWNEVKKSFPQSQICIPYIKYCIFIRFLIFPFHFQKTLLFHIVFHCLKANLQNIQIKVLHFEFNINIALSQQKHSLRGNSKNSVSQSLDEITQLHSLMGESPSHRGKCSSVPSTNQCPGRASKVVLRQDARLPLHGEKVHGEKGGRSTCEES